MLYVGFDWDEGNARKNEKHGVSKPEVEQVFLNAPLLLADDLKHSQREPRFHALGKTDQDRWLQVTFTERASGTLIRPISARTMSRKERAVPSMNTQIKPKQLKPIPKFADEAEERAFWESPKNDSTEYVDWSKARLVTFPKLRPSTETISLRMPEDVLNTIRHHARRLDVPYQSLIKLWCAEKVAELKTSSSTGRRGNR
jgi:hypothetical protein